MPKTCFALTNRHVDAILNESSPVHHNTNTINYNDVPLKIQSIHAHIS